MNDCYDKILNLYHKKIGDNLFEIRDEAWVLNSNYLMKLMEQLEKKID